MSDQHTGPDALAVYLTGAEASGGYQPSQGASLGGYYSYVRSDSMAVFRNAAMSTVRIDRVAPFCGIGIGSLEAANANALRWAPPGQDFGPSVAIANGETKQLPGPTDYDDRYVIVTRISADDFIGSEEPQLLDIVNNVIAGDNLTEAGSRYRAVMLRNNSQADVTGIVIWVDPDYATDIAIAIEAPVDGAIQTIPDDATAPLDLMFTTPVSQATGLAVGTLAAAQVYGLWIRRTASPGYTADPLIRIVLHIAFTVSTVEYAQTLRGIYRRADADAQYELYIGQDAPPTIDGVPDASSPTLPFDSPALTPGHVYYFQTAYRNAYGLRSLDQTPTVFNIAADATDSGQPPLDPAHVQIDPYGAGQARIYAAYYPNTESSADNCADTWLIYLRADGTDPDPDLDTPATQAMPGGTAPQILNWPTPDTYLEAAPIRVLIRTRRTGTLNVDSTGSTIYSTAIEAYGPDAPLGLVTIGRAMAVHQDAPDPTATIWIDETHGIKWVVGPGYSQLWAGSVLVWNTKYDTEDNESNGVYSTFGMHHADITGASEQNQPIEVVSATLLYVNVAGTRRMEIDITNSLINVGGMAYTSPAQSAAHEPAARMYEDTSFLVYDPGARQWITAWAVHTDGRIDTAIGWKKKDTQEECL